MNKHTPGPWEVRKPILRGKYRGDFAVGPKSHEGYNQDPVFCHLAKGRDDIQAANAALIAAAPELLEAAKLAEAVLVNHINMDPKMYRKYRDAWEPLVAAIAKAEGR